MVVLRPFKVGDFVTAGGVTGTVDEVGLFGTTINTPDNVRTTVGNNKIFSDTIQNFSANPYRRVELVAQLSHGDDHRAAIATLKGRWRRSPTWCRSRPPRSTSSPSPWRARVLAVRPYCHNDSLLAGVLRHQPHHP